MKKDPLFKALIIFGLAILALTLAYAIYVAVTVSAIAVGTAVLTSAFATFSYIVLATNAILLLLAILYLHFRKI